ncbi:hypothetical protein [Paenibacillus lentus]|nr:hypothetical protein [Paenibacillus lentus]
MEQTEENESKQSQDNGRREDDRMLTVDDILDFYANGRNFYADGQQ